MANHPGIKEKYFDKLRVLINAAAPLGPLDAAKLRKRAKKNIAIRQGKCAFLSLEILIKISKQSKNTL